MSHAQERVGPDAHRGEVFRDAAHDKGVQPEPTSHPLADLDAEAALDI